MTSTIIIHVSPLAVVVILFAHNMTSLPNASDEYVVESSGSDDDRPNRWHGPSSTWQQMNSEEIDTLIALNKIRNRDLSIHLYNAFALKQRHKNLRNDTLPVPDEVEFPSFHLNTSAYAIAKLGSIRISMQRQGRRSNKMTGCHSAPGPHGRCRSTKFRRQTS